MRRSSYVYAPLLAAAAVTVLSGCQEVRGCAPSSSACSEVAPETRVGGFGANFANDPVVWWFGIAGVIVVAGRFSAGG